MASGQTSTALDPKKQRMSFAKIAAAAVKPQNAQQGINIVSSPTSNLKHELPSSLRDSAPLVSPSYCDSKASVAPTQKKRVHLASKEAQGINESGKNAPPVQVRVQIVESVQPPRSEDNTPATSLAPVPDDMGTQVSSSSDSNKPQSLDGKSTASGTTFALDEKESLRPDDSASVKAVEEDDIFSQPGPGLPVSRMGSDDGARAFRDQLREISSMEPRRRDPPPPGLVDAHKGILYVPPSGPGIGVIPNVDRGVPSGTSAPGFPPDQKLLEALENPRDRVWVLKLEQDVIDFVKDPKESSLTLPQCHSFYRLLAHKMADYYMLGHLVDDTSAAVRLFKTPNCRIPPPLTGIFAPSTAACTPPPSAPQMKILRRGVDKPGPGLADGSNSRSKSGSDNGESGNEEDRKPKAPVTREEREARYEAARLRIMGSARPTESPEVPKDTQESRPSSTNGKKFRKKQHTDSDDGFEARSAYSNYYTSAFAADAHPSTPYAFHEYSEGSHNPLSNLYSQQSAPGGMQHTAQQLHGNGSWGTQPYQPADSSWTQNGQPGAFDLSADFNRSMSLQNQNLSHNPGTPWNGSFAHSHYAPQQGWSHQYQTQPTHPTHAGYGYGSAHTPSALHSGQEQPYAYGQLPSQAFPGQPASSTEHPLPGSYKGKHFNPQIQSFVPGQWSGGSFTPQTAPVNHFTPGFASPAQLQRQNSAQSQASAFGSPHHTPPHAMGSRATNQPLTHPLPHGPVFPRQPSPGLPLPPKPGPAPSKVAELSQQTPPVGPHMHVTHNQSLIAKWGAPASLPAKPPPSADPYETSKFAQTPRQPYANLSPTTTRQPPYGYPTLGSMSPSAQIVNGSGSMGAKRA